MADKKAFIEELAPQRAHHQQRRRLINRLTCNEVQNNDNKKRNENPLFFARAKCWSVFHNNRYRQYLG